MSELQSAASRANGARSRGPVTPQGKRNSSRNGIRHGLLSKTITLQGESGHLRGQAEQLSAVHAATFLANWVRTDGRKWTLRTRSGLANSALTVSAGITGVRS